ncbi:hypothetical protein CVU82_00185 [Candidatus Falkowbacteria bacterium HGW-Falkowbacteria-1]|jgi:hypothetical protein|uniref:Uncharacterized protein n=1 Tax=Candidatus Falkowbacteria bacterium HGW-Falkowbacteria-1 TaxID=2013768 RepID=A0A2N2EA68_9BACT|nr:MAG: hypothetical protein CVU82_00185 [Candidatus Falkowbacteria bacterium HGW-Falkowbacteria-1]
MEHKHEHSSECKHEHHEEKKEIKTEKISEKSKKQQQTVFILISALVLLLLAVLIFKFPPKEKNTLTLEDAKIKTESFINENLMMPGTKATIENAEEEYGLYKLSVNVGTGENIESYIDKKGTLFFPQAFEIDTYVNPYLDEAAVNIEEAGAENEEPVLKLEETGATE